MKKMRTKTTRSRTKKRKKMRMTKKSSMKGSFAKFKARGGWGGGGFVAREK